MNIKPLPDKLSALIRVAVADLQAVMKDDRYEVDFTRWHTKEDIDACGKLSQLEKCHVCLAGSVIAKSFEAPISERLVPQDFEHEVSVKLIALDYAREGRILDALYYVTNENEFFDLFLPPALNCPIPPKSLKVLPRWLTGIASELEAISL